MFVDGGGVILLISLGWAGPEPPYGLENQVIWALAAIIGPWLRLCYSDNSDNGDLISASQGKQ